MAWGFESLRPHSIAGPSHGDLPAVALMEEFIQIWKMFEGDESCWQTV